MITVILSDVSPAFRNVPNKGRILFIRFKNSSIYIAKGRKLYHLRQLSFILLKNKAPTMSFRHPMRSSEHKIFSITKLVFLSRYSCLAGISVMGSP